MRQVAICSMQIRPGGGPAGYAWNLEQALNAWHSGSTMGYAFWGDRSSERTSAKPMSSVGKSVAQRLKRFVLQLSRGRLWTARDFIELHLTERGKCFRSTVSTSDAIVFHGPMSKTWVRWALRNGGPMAYMPHSPTPRAREVQMLHESMHETAPVWLLNWEHKTESFMMDSAQIIVAPSASAFTNYLSTFAGIAAKVHYLPSAGPDLASEGDSPSPAELNADRPLVLFAGRYVLHKGYDLFCLAAEILQEKLPNVQFLTVGAGPLASPKSVARDMGWQRDITPWIKKSSVVVVPNRVAYFDLLPLEVASMGKPLVMTPVGGNIDQASHLPHSILSVDLSPESLADAIEASLTRSRADEDYGALNRLAYLEKFGFQQFAKNWMQVFEDLCESRSD